MAKTPDSNLVRTGETADRVFERLIEGILSGAFPGGHRLRESRLATQWSVSRTPLREAVRRAAEAGFVVLRPNQAPVVRLLTQDDVTALYGLRAVLEGYALELAWPQRRHMGLELLQLLARRAAPEASRTWRQSCLDFDRALHATWSEHCGNAWLQTDLNRQHQFLRIFQRWIGRDEAALRVAYAEHQDILEALVSGTRQAALTALRHHIQTSAEAVVRVLSARSAQFPRQTGFSEPI